MTKIKELYLYIVMLATSFLYAGPVMATGKRTISSYSEFIQLFGQDTDNPTMKNNFNGLVKVGWRGLLVYTAILLVIGLIALVVAATRMATDRNPTTRFIAMKAVASQLIVFGLIGALPVVVSVILMLI